MNQEIISEIQAIVGKENCSTDIAEIYAYGFDASIHRVLPDIVIRPKRTEEVQKIILLANKYKIPIVPRGSGTALCGHSLPINRGIVIDMKAMNKIKEIRVGDLYCVVEPGVIYADLNKELGKYNFLFPPEPGSGDVCSIGGMVATNASGIRAIKYGATRDYVMALEVVLPTGEIIRVGTKTIKDSSGYQLARFFVGSEGTLGIITEITLRIIPKSEKQAVVLASFDSLEKAGQCIANIISSGLIPSAIEIIDKTCIEAVNKSMKIGLPESEALVLIEVDGHPVVVKEQNEKVAKICLESKAIKVDFTDDEKRMEELWKGRKGVLPSLSKYGEKFVSVSLADDMAVPISQIPKAVVEFQKIAKKYGIIIGTYGHAGDGNLHTKMLLDPKSEEHWKRGEKATEEIFDAVLKLGGTITGEHGVAITKAPYLLKEKKDTVELQKKIKLLFDPNNIMNPNKNVFWEKGIIYSLRYPCVVERD